MNAVRRLGLHSRVPPWIKMNHCVSSRQVKANTARLQADQEYWYLGISLESRDHLATVCRCAIEIGIPNALSFQSLSNQRQHADKLAEHEHPVAAVDDFFEQFAEQFELAGGSRWIDFLELQQAQITTDLSQSQQCAQNYHPAAGHSLRSHRIHHFLAARFQNLPINLLLIRCQFTERDLFQFRQQILQYVPLQTPQDKPLQTPGQTSVAFRVSFPRPRNFVPLPEILGRAQITLHQKVED